RLRVPYQGGAGSEAPGWHYLNFARPVVAGTFVWLTAFDEPKPIPATRIGHANGVRGVVGLVFDLDSDGLECLARLAGQPVIQGELRIGDVTVTAVEANDSDRRFPLRAVLLQADSLDGFATERSSMTTQLMGRSAVRIQTNPLCWDLWITA
ncbi:MAG TPA: hypothetical protein VGK53_10590, partial [Propionicimonas sp.]